MNYRSKQEKVEKEVKRIKYIALAIVLFLVASLCIFSVFVPAHTWKYYVSKPKTTLRTKGALRIHYIDVGQGDATLLELPDGKTLLIDGGDDSERTEKSVLRYLNALKIDTLDYLVVTHTDKDHYGGLSAVLEYKKVKTAFVPYVKNVTKNATYARFHEKLLNEKCEIEYSSQRFSLSANGAYPYVLEFLYPKSIDVEGQYAQEFEDNNESSAVIWLDYKGVSALFCGDITEDVEKGLMAEAEMGLFENRNVQLNSTEILKVAHHGSASSSSLAFLQYLGLKTAIISCGKDNVYGHPSKTTLDRLSSVNADVRRTDWLGHIMITVDETGGYKTQKVAK